MEKVRILDPKVDAGHVEQTLERARALFPELRYASATARWAGYIDSTPDGVCAIGETAEVPGLVLAAGFSGHGFGVGPGAGKLIADLVTGDAPLVDPKPYHPSRFTKGPGARSRNSRSRASQPKNWLINPKVRAESPAARGGGGPAPCA